ncbi:hypothetical protein PtA15_12A568 [Puccinia triticina]|uniref:Uncharacterized protein n=1 Tax=Puccinia triticina TaxID=208348 RepID=A0ABY7CZ37_9BASI|nr:uncharacterized protein PtA15_12A568 [Puccinia triticina]WAQ90578.1 hypothetical protein PtA15_12A568 [Puccinia triticina]WAR61891.1 hypothetical protein PtB15_12B583 [Puccinia triticina]
MIASRYVLAAAISLITAKSTEGNNMNSWCDTYPANQAHCYKAIANIKLENGKLPSTENEVRTIADSCSLIVFNKNLMQDITPAQITEAVTAHFEKCPDKAGWIILPSNKQVLVQIKIRAPPNSQWSAWNSDAELKKAYCYRPEGESAIGSGDDCIAAYQKFPIDPRTGYLIGLVPTPMALELNSGSCTVQISTTDGSDIQMNKKEVDSAIIGMMNKCGNTPGVVNVNGAQGPNGRIFVQTYSSSQE